MNMNPLDRLKDKRFYLENFVKIKGKKPGALVPFILNQAQLDLYNAVNEYSRVIILKSRQIGFSTAMTGYFYVDTIMNPGTTTAIIGYNSDLTAELLDKVKTFHRTTPDSLKPTMHYNSKYEMSFPSIDSKIIVLPSTTNVGRGYTLTNCLAGDTPVYMKNGTTKQIKNVKTGDMVLNSNGKYDVVASTSKIVNKKQMFEVDVVGGGKIRLTYDHRLLCRDKKTKKAIPKMVKDINVGNWKKWSEKHGDYIAFPSKLIYEKRKKITIENFIKKGYKSRSNSCKDEIKLDYNFGLLIGWYLAEGHIPAKKQCIIMCINKRETEEVLELINIFKDYFGKVRIRTKKDTLSTTITMEGTNFARFINSIFGRVDNKRINDCVWGWGKEFIDGLLLGFVKGDGTINDKKRIHIVNTNESIMNQIKLLLISRKIGYANLTRVKSFRYGVKGKDRFDLVLSGPGNYKFRKIFNLELPVYDNNYKSWYKRIKNGRNIGFHRWRRGANYYWARIRSVKEVKSEEYVYNIGLKNDPHVFHTPVGCVFNCLVTELSSWDDAEEKMMTLEASVPIDGKLVIESCVSGDTLILTNNGFSYVKDIHDWDNHKLGFSEGENIMIDGHYGLKPTSTYYNSGIKKGFKVTTKKGYELKMSSVHKMLILRGDKLLFVKSKDLMIGDNLTIKHGQEVWGSNKEIDWNPTPYKKGKKYEELFNPKVMTKDLAYLIGVITGDGYVNGKGNYVIIANSDIEIVDFLLNNNLGLNFIKEKREKGSHFRCSNKAFVEFLQDYIGFKEGDKASSKRISKVIFSLDRDNVIAFLQGLFDTDGSCRKDRGLVSFSSTSKDIIDVLRVFLLNFGIISHTSLYVTKPSKLVKAISSVYSLEINKAHSNVFLEKIGFRVKRKNNGTKTNEAYSSLQDFLPGIGKELKKNMHELGLKYSDIKNGLNKSFFSKSGNITYRTLGKILKKCRNKKSDYYKHLKTLYSKKYFYNEIKEITPIEENVYDFTVDDGSTVSYNGMIGHQTPRGVGNLYHKMWMAKDNGYEKRKYGWKWGYTQEEIDMIKRRMNNPMRFAQEYGLEFLSSGRPVFDAKLVARHRKNVLKLGDTVTEEGATRTIKDDDGLVMYKEPVPGKFYVSGADVSEGVEGGDYSVATIFDRATGEEVASYRGLLPADVFGDKLNVWGRKYNNALMVVEVNNHGLTTITVLKQKIYPSLYFRPAKFETLGNPMSDKIGWRTTRLTRNIMIDEFAQMFRDGDILIHTKELLDEMSVFVYNDAGNMVPMQGYHDDTIFATAIALQGFKQMYHKALAQIDYSEHMPSNFSY